jgi:hypothetical protein
MNYRTRHRMCENVPCLRPSDLRRIFKMGAAGTICTRINGYRVSSVWAECWPHHVNLTYNLGGRSWFDAVDIDKTPCTYGGERLWFRCPRCDRRCDKIYLAPHAACRTCHGLRYWSQYQPPVDRVEAQISKHVRKLDDRATILDDFPPRPRYMHYATYRKLEQKYEDMGIEYLEAIDLDYPWSKKAQ